MKFLRASFVCETTHGHHQWRWKAKPYSASEVSGQFGKRLAGSLVAVVLRTEDKPLAVSTYRWSARCAFLFCANPVVASFGATLRKQVVTTLRSGVAMRWSLRPLRRIL